MRRSSYWRQQARAIIDRVIILYLKGNPDAIDIKKLKAEIRRAYPFGQRKNYPYKVWCEKVKKALSCYQETDKALTPCLVQSNRQKSRGGKSSPPIPPGQLSLDL